MDLSKFCVLSIVLVSLCGVVDSRRTHPTTILIDTHFKRESELDCRLREKGLSKPLPASLEKSHKIRPVIATKVLNPLSIRPHIITRKRIVPLVNKPPVPLTSITEDKTNEPVIVPEQYINTNKHNDTKTNELNEPNLNSLIEPPTMPKNDNNYLREEDDNDIRKAPELIKKENIKNLTSKIVLEGEIEQIPSQEIKNTVENVTEVDINVNLHKVISDATADQFLQKVKAMQITNNKPKIHTTGQETEVNTIRNITTFDENNVTEDIKPIGLDAKVNPKVQQLTIINPLTYSVPNILLPRKNLNQSPISLIPWKNVIEDNPEISQKNEKNNYNTPQINVKSESNDVKPDVEPDSSLLNPSIIEPNKELVIQNDNYEELYDSTASPQYGVPKLIVSVLNPIQNWNSISTLSDTPYEIYKTNNAELSEPYTYDVHSYPDHYVVNTYDGLANGNFNSNNISNKENAYQWNQGYNYHQLAPNYSALNYLNNYQYQQYPRIWRTWSNNRIIIRPKSGSTMNSDVIYNDINRYITNARNVPAYNSAKFINPYGYIIQNISPYSYSNPIWFNQRNGY